MHPSDILIGRTTDESLNFKLYFGPLEYDRVEALGVGLEQSMYFGWSFCPSNFDPRSASVLPLAAWILFELGHRHYRFLYRYQACYDTVFDLRDALDAKNESCAALSDRASRKIQGRSQKS